MDFRVGKSLIEVKGIHSSKEDRIVEAFEHYGYEVEIIHCEYIDLLYNVLKSERRVVLGNRNHVIGPFF